MVTVLCFTSLGVCGSGHAWVLANRPWYEIKFDFGVCGEVSMAASFETYASFDVFLQFREARGCYLRLYTR